MDNRKREKPVHIRAGRKTSVIQVPVEPELLSDFKRIANRRNMMMTTLIRRLMSKEIEDGKV